MNLKDFIIQKAEKGFCFFTSEEAEKALGVSSLAVRRAIHRSQKKGELAEPLRGFHVIVTPEYRKIGCLPADQFIPDLMEFLKSSYYVCLLSASQYHGAAHQRPQVFQVMSEHGRRPINCKKVRIEFITNKNIINAPVQKMNTKQGILNISTPELTALDLVTYQDRAAGIDNVFNILIELAEKIDPNKLIELWKYKPEVTWLQRLGYLFDISQNKDLANSIAEFVKDKRLKNRPLSPSSGININTPFNEKWKIWINEEVEADV